MCHSTQILLYANIFHFYNSSRNPLNSDIIEFDIITKVFFHTLRHLGSLKIISIFKTNINDNRR